MSRIGKRLIEEESGAELVEWALVTVILILAIYAILQAVGPDIENFRWWETSCSRNGAACREDHRTPRVLVRPLTIIAVPYIIRMAGAVGSAQRLGR